MDDYRTYFQIRQRKQKQSQAFDNYFGDTYEEGIEDSLLDKRVTSTNCEMEVQQKRILTNFVQSYDQYPSIINVETNLEENISDSTSEENLELEMVEREVHVYQPCIDDFKVLEVDEVNYIQELSNPAIVRNAPKNHKNLSKKIFKTKQ